MFPIAQANSGDNQQDQQIGQDGRHRGPGGRKIHICRVGDRQPSDKATDSAPAVVQRDRAGRPLLAHSGHS
jgi:hypothetical protein